MGTLLEPLKTQIKDFRDKVEQAQSDSKTGVAKLEGLIGSLGSLNQQLAEEARNLTTALRGSSKTQGDWGEFILRDLLEKAGLREGRAVQLSAKFYRARRRRRRKGESARTDVIVYLAGRPQSGHRFKGLSHRLQRLRECRRRRAHEMPR